MGKNQSASNITNIIKQDANGGITFMSGSTTLMAIGSSGAITTTGTISGSDAANAVSASYALISTTATTASYADNLLVKGSITAQTLVVQTITSSVDFVTGSTKFGSIGSNTHVFTGSMSVSGSGTFGALSGTTGTFSGSVGIGTLSPSVKLDVFNGDVALGSKGEVEINSNIGTLGFWTNDVNVGLKSVASIYVENDGPDYWGGGTTNWSTRMKFRVLYQNSYKDALTITSTGAATFSSSVTATQGLFYSGNGTSTQIQLGNGNVYYYNIGRYSADGLLYFYGNQSGYTGYVFGGVDGERMRITSGGNVGIGTTDPNQLLTFGFADNGTNGVSFRSSTYANLAKILVQNDTSTSNGNIQFHTRSGGDITERMRITSNGNFQIGTFATAGNKYFGYAHTNGDIAGAGSSGLRWESVAVGGNYSQSIYIRTHYYNAASRNAIFAQYDGNVYNYNNSTAWQTTSDIRIKENIRPISNALDKINALNPSHFEYKNKLGQIKTGFIAQEFEQIFPGHVIESLPNEDNKQYFEEGEMMKSIDADLIPYLVKAIQELKAQNDALTARIEQLENK